ncbi:MAG: tyrosine-protein phosphatase [Cyclobacteriaceae bacterium]|jgi:protein-tyrosine phosphatase|nr:capsular biosynthesis protein [Flammeovirgaceae bacterium]
MFSIFKRSQPNSYPPLHCDIHSHLLAGIDDGAKDWEDSITLIIELKKCGFSKLITTPHIMNDVYRNTPEIIHAKLQELNKHLAAKQIEIEIEAAAEYYLDETLFKQVQADTKLLTFGKRYLLFETNFYSEPYFLKDFIFHATTQGYQLILAHPERYGYMTLSKAEDLKNRGVLLQLNSLSLSTFYSTPIQKMAQQLIDKGWVDFLGSDCHNLLQATELAKTMKQKYYRKALELPLLNNTL